MKQLLSSNCPQPSLLVDFLQGKLEPPALDDCEAHLEQCPQCHETLRGLDSSDTLSEKVTDALMADLAAESSDSVQIDGLIQRLTSGKFQTRSPAVAQVASSEVMADRAAEVLRCVQSDDETLGLLGDYALLRLIGSGSTGVVFQALDRTLQRTVALKVLRPSLGELARERFLAEARSAASIEHANVVTIFQVGQVDRLAFIAMPWLPGQTLEAKLQSGGSLNETQVTDTVLKVANGLAAAHQSQLVHRDIKPANLWICDTDEQIKILDFGLARINDDNPGLTATGILAGTPNFMSPEQARGLELDGRSDLFSLGCLMYQLLTGRLPFGASTILGTLQSVQNESPIPPRQIKPDVSQHLSDLTMCLLEKQPANRPESANQLVEMLSSPRNSWPILVNQYAGPPEEKPEVARALSNSAKAAGQSGGIGWLVTAILLGLGGWVAWAWSPQIVRVMTDQGEVVIESTAEDVEIQVFADGKLCRVLDTQTQQSFELKSGKYTFAAQSSGDEKNTFTVSPNQLTMKRGSTQIVKVTTPEKTNTPPQINADKVSSPPYDQPVYDGHTFEYWINVAEHDRDRVKSSGALMAAAAIAESPAQETQLIELVRTRIRKLTRRYSPHQTSRAKASLQYVNARRSINSVESDLVMKFIKTEIREGTLGSRSFLTYWIYESGGYGRDTYNDGARWQATIKNSVDFFELAATNLDQPGNDSLVDAFAWLASENGAQDQIVAKANESGFTNELEKLLISGSASSRLERVLSARVLLGNNQAIYAKYEQDLFDLQVPIRNREIIFDEFICDPNLRNVFPDQRGATLLRCAKTWKSGKAFDQLIKFKPFLSDTFRRDELESTENRQQFSKIFTRTDLEKLFSPKDMTPSSTIDATSKEKNESSSTAFRSLPSGDKPIFQGRTFDHWLRSAQRDRDAATRAGALKACAATAETDEEIDSLIKLTRKLCRKYGGNVLGNSTEADLYYNSLAEAINSLDVNQIVKFIEMEIVDGTEASRKFCHAWLVALTGGVIPKEWRSKIKSVREMAGPLEDALANNLEKPGNSLVLLSLVDSDRKESFKESALAKTMKRLVADPDQRLLLHRSIINMQLDDDPEIFQLYRDDLLDPKTNPATRSQLFDSLRNQPEPALPRQWVGLFFDVADGVLRQGEQRLHFTRDFGRGPEKLRAEHRLTEVLIELNRLEPQLDEKFKTETLLPRLKELKKTIKAAADDPERSADFIASNVKTLLADFDYLIEKIPGNADAKLPEGSLLKLGYYPWTSSVGGMGGGGGGMF
jgi:serine/threonine protein kinase